MNQWNGYTDVIKDDVIIEDSIKDDAVEQHCVGVDGDGASSGEAVDADLSDGSGSSSSGVDGGDGASGGEAVVGGVDVGDVDVGGWESERFEAVAEAILFASGEPLSLERIALIVGRAPAEVKALLDRMEERLRNSKRGLLLREISGKFQLCTKPELSNYVNKLFEIKQKQSLSQAAYETLSIVAYNADVTRSMIEKIRGVNSDSPIEKLLERGLIIETGRARLPGRPMRYDVTEDFYRLFGFKSRSDLPDLNDDAVESDTVEPDTIEFDISVVADKPQNAN